MRFQSARLFVTLAVLSPSSAWAQQDSAHSPPDTTRAQTLDYTFTIPLGERVWVFLEGGATYRAELTGRGIQLRLRPIQAGTQAPLVEALLPGQSAGGTSLYTSARGQTVNTSFARLVGRRRTPSVCI